MTPREWARPSHADAAGRAYLALRASAKGDGRSMAEYLRLYFLEGYLLRLAHSQHAKDLVLKGGVLLAAYDSRRPTVDIDFAAIATSNDAGHVLALIREIATTQLAIDDDDGIVYDSETARADAIREETLYPGVRVTMQARLSTARETFHVDVNVGDPILPAPQLVRLPRLLGGEIELLGYPIELVLAEKIVTAVQRGIANTRWRDFADVYLLTGMHESAAAEVASALAGVAEHRGVTLATLRSTLDGYPELADAKWRAWRSRQHLDDRLPTHFGEVLDAVYRFADPLLADQGSDVASRAWSPSGRAWITSRVRT